MAAFYFFFYELHFVALNSACRKGCCSSQKFSREHIFLEVQAQTEGTKKGQKKPGRLAHHCQHSCLYKACFGSFTVICSILKRVAVKRNSFQHIDVPFHDPRLPSTFFSSQFRFRRRNWSSTSSSRRNLVAGLWHPQEFVVQNVPNGALLPLLLTMASSESLTGTFIGRIGSCSRTFSCAVPILAVLLHPHKPPLPSHHPYLHLHFCLI